MNQALLAVAVFAAVYLLIASGRFSNAALAILGAAALVIMGVLSSEAAFAHVDLNVILLLAGMMVIAHVVAMTGFFDWAALVSARLVGGRGLPLLVLLALVTALGSAFLDNVTTVVLMVPVTLSLASALGLDPVPFLLTEVFASNVGGVTTLIGDPPNIIVASVADISFLQFLVHVGPAGLLALAVLLAVVALWFRRGLTVAPERRERLLSRRPAEAIRDPRLLRWALGVLGLTIVGFLFHGLLGVEPAFIALGGAGLLLVATPVDTREVLKEVEWPTLSFFVGLFVLVGGLVETGAIDFLQRLMVDVAGDDPLAMATLLLWGSGLLSGVIDNIPYTATMAQVVAGLTAQGGQGDPSPLWWALVLGADLGGNLTLVGASANVVVVNMAQSRGHPITFMRFLRYGLVVTPVTLLVSTLFLWLRYYL